MGTTHEKQNTQITPTRVVPMKIDPPAQAAPTGWGSPALDKPIAGIGLLYWRGEDCLSVTSYRSIPITVSLFLQ